jgi:hypothetical protein
LLDFECVVIVGRKFLKAIVTIAVSDGFEAASNCRAVCCDLDSGECGAGTVEDLAIDASIRRSLA